MIIATRNLTVASGSQEERIAIAVSAPEPSDEMWVCRYEIGWPGRARTSFAAGVDSVQALHLALQRIGLDLYMSPHHRSGQLRWEKAGDGYGFPVPRNGRDLLVGADEVFDGQADDAPVPPARP